MYHVISQRGLWFSDSSFPDEVRSSVNDLPIYSYAKLSSLLSPGKLSLLVSPATKQLIVGHAPFKCKYAGFI